MQQGLRHGSFFSSQETPTTVTSTATSHFSPGPEPFHRASTPHRMRAPRTPGRSARSAAVVGFGVVILYAGTGSVAADVETGLARTRAPALMTGCGLAVVGTVSKVWSSRRTSSSSEPVASET